LRKKSTILNPLWITQGSYLDPEYFNYILLAATQGYREDLENGELKHFYEILFHSLNLNNLAVDGKLFDFKMKSYFDGDRIKRISDDLSKIYENKTEVVEIFKNANYVFLNLLLEYMDEQTRILEVIKIITKNELIHTQSEIFIVSRGDDTNEYSIWKLKFNKKSNFGYTFKKVGAVTIDELKPNALREEITKLNNPELEKIDEAKNVCFVLTYDIDTSAAMNVVKDTFLLNRFIAKDNEFHGGLIFELQELIISEKLIPFTLNQWND
jgi:hypothetical protein